MKRHTISLIFLNIILPIVLGACTMDVITRNDLAISISYPEEGSILPLAPVGIYAGATSYDPGRTVTRISFFQNGVSIGRDTILEVSGEPAFRDYHGDIRWNPPGPGEYFLQAIIERPRVSSDPVRICIIDFQISAPSVDFTNPPTGYEGPCPIPARDEFATPGEQSLSASVSTDRILYAPAGVTGCPVTGPITFEAALLDPPQDVAFIFADYSVTGTLSGSHPGRTFGRTIVLNYVRTSPTGTKFFAGSTVYSLNNILAEFHGSESGELTWAVRAIGRDGATILSVGPFTIPVEPCTPSGAIPPILLHLETPTETPTLTATPASDKDCPPGTYFAPATNRCIAIQIITSVPDNGNNGGSGGNSCTPPPRGCGADEYWSSATCSCQILQ
jgi:hypothetical protein